MNRDELITKLDDVESRLLVISGIIEKQQLEIEERKQVNIALYEELKRKRDEIQRLKRAIEMDNSKRPKATVSRNNVRSKGRSTKNI